MTPAEVAPWLLLVMETVVLAAGLYLLVRGKQVAASSESSVKALGIEVSSPTPGVAVTAFAVVALIVTLMVGALTGPEPDSDADDGPGPTDSPTTRPDPTATTQPASLTCWDGSRVTSASGCPTPVGRAGMKSVFPALDDECEPPANPIREGKAEVFLCDYDGYSIRYSRWESDYNWVRYYDLENPGAATSAWAAGGEPAGRQWTSLEPGGDEDLKFQWSAAYAAEPYSVSVEASTKPLRKKGRERVQAVAPSRIGLR